MEATSAEHESRIVLECLREVSGLPFNHEEPITDYYGRPETLDTDTALLCSWCKTHDVSKQSLELQLWWQRHQKADAKREAEEQRRAQRQALKQQALSKLTPEERAALKVEE